VKKPGGMVLSIPLLSLMIAFQAACWDDPEELFGSQEFRLSVDPGGQIAVLFTNAERKDLLPAEEAADDVFPLFVVNRFDVAPVVLRLFDGSVGIVKRGSENYWNLWTLAMERQGVSLAVSQGARVIEKRPLKLKD
jgi:hypothetical protein